jgi:hypothetical protein
MQHFRGKKAAFLKAFRQAPAVAPAADKIGVHRCTVHRWMKADPTFTEAVEDARSAAVDDIEAVHFEKAKDKDTLARIHILRSRRGDVYADRAETQPPPAPSFTQNNLTLSMANQSQPDIQALARSLAIALQASGVQAKTQKAAAVVIDAETVAPSDLLDTDAAD